MDEDAARRSAVVPGTNLGPDLQRRILGSLESLCAALDLKSDGEDQFLAGADMERMPGRIYGGQLLAQAVVAAGRTMASGSPSWLSASFVGAGTPGRPVQILVERVHDGRSMATRRVSVVEHARVLMTAVVSFKGDVGTNCAPGQARAQDPESVPLIQHWARQVPPASREDARHWIDAPPPLELRVPDAPAFLHGTSTTTSGTHWMRVPRDVGDDGLLHAALLAYASDFLLMDMVFRSRRQLEPVTRWNGYSLNHCVWFHAPCRIDGWHSYTQELIADDSGRGLVSGEIRSADDGRVATVVQEALIVANE